MFAFDSRQRNQTPQPDIAVEHRASQRVQACGFGYRPRLVAQRYPWAVHVVKL